MRVGLNLVIIFIILSINLGFGQSKIKTDSSIISQIHFANNQFEVENTDTAIYILESLIPQLEKEGQNKLLIEVFSNLSFKYYSLQQSEKIKPYALKAINLADSLKIKSFLLDKAYYSLIKLYSSSQYEKVVELAPDALSKMTDKTLLPFVNIHYVEALTVLGKYDAAKVQVENYEKTISEKEEKVYLFYLKGRIETATRNYELAVQYLNQALDISKQFTEIDKNILVRIYDLSGSNYSYLFKNDLAIESMEKALEMDLSIQGITCQTGSIYGNIAYSYLEKGIQTRNEDAFNTAINFYQKAIDSSRVYCNNDASLATYFHMMAYTYYSMKSFETVHSILDSSIHYAELYSLDNIMMENYTVSAITNTQLKKYKESLEDMNYLLSKQIPAFKPTNYQDNPTFFRTDKYFTFGQYIAYKAEAFSNKWQQERDTTDLFATLRTYELAFQFFEEQKKDLSAFELSKRSYRKHLSGVHNSYLKALYYQYEVAPTDTNLFEIYTELEKRKALSLIENIPLINDVLPDSTVQQEQAFRNKSYQLEQQTINFNLANKTDSLTLYRKELLDNKINYNAFLDNVEKDYPNYIKYRFKNEISKIATVQKLLKEDMIIINYAIINDYILIYTITSNKVKVTYHEIGKINTLIESLKLLTDSPLLIQDKNRLKFISTANQLYEKLIEPIEDEIKSKKQLFIIPERNLFYIPFELLLSSNENLPFEKLEFLIKKFEVNYLYASSSLERLRNNQPIRNKSLLAFAPVFENGINLKNTNRDIINLTDSLYRSFDNAELLALPNSEIEVKNISKVIKKNNGQTELLIRRNATKTNLLKKLNNKYQFLHIATHGLVNFEEPKLSSLACFTNETVDEILLFTNEIQMQSIQADLVILSSCESGIGQLAFGEGLLALNRSFIYAGANNVLFSLWKVNDEYTSELMIDFYKFYFQSESYTTALRQAKLKMLQNPITANPRYWAAFVLIGE